jgi:acyl carrier protein
MSIRLATISEIAKVAVEQQIKLKPLTDNSILLDTLDSLCLAILVARLEDQLGIDPFSPSDVNFPTTLGEFVWLYEASARSKTLPSGQLSDGPLV